MLTVVVFVLLLIALVLTIPMMYKILTGDSMNAVCKEMAGRILTIPFVGFKPLAPLCDIIAPGGTG
jgi:hypothetical protein